MASVQAWPSAQIVLESSEKRERAIPFLTAAQDSSLWPRSHPAALGASTLNDLHAGAIEAVAEVAALKTGRLVLDRPAPPSRSHLNNGRALADWLLEVASEPGHSIRPELPYLFASGAHRARALARVLGRLACRPIIRLADNGAAIGMISWLLAADLPNLQSVQLFEPESRFRMGLERLWRMRRDGLDYNIAQTKAENALYATGTDLILFCHCLLCVRPEERRPVLRRAWAALPPGGVLMINEAVQDSSTPAPRRPDMLHREELISIMPGHPQLFREQTSWTVPEDPSEIKAAEIGYSGVLVSVRD